MISKTILNKILLVCLVLSLASSKTILDPSNLKPYMFTYSITGDLVPLQPTKLGYSKSIPYPVDTY